MVLYEGLQIVESYTLTFSIRLFQSDAELISWVILFGVLLIYDELFARLDNQVDWHIWVKHFYEIYEYLKIKSIEKFLSLEVPWHNRRNSGTLVGKVSDGTWKIIDVLMNLSRDFFPTLIQAFLSLIPVLYFSPLTAIVVLVSLLMFIGLSIQSHKLKKPFQKIRHDHYDEEWQRGIETVQSIETVQMFGQEKRLADEFRQVHSNISGSGREELNIGLFYNRWQIRILTIGRRLILATWLWQLSIGTMDIPTLFFVSALSEKLFTSVWRFVRLIDRVSESTEAINRLHDLHKEPNQKRVGFPIPEQAKNKLDISLVNVNFAYEGEYTEERGTLHNFSLEIPFGAKIALVGPSGAGKTTIQKIVTGKYPIQSGTIRVGGIDVREWPEDELLRQFSHVPQGDDVHIMAGSLSSNIAFPKKDATPEEIVNAARLAGIHSFIESLPEKYETRVGERGKRLSGGQKQRIALARAILADRPILILDEATSAVDAMTEREIQSQMETILKGKTAIIIAHRLSTIWNLADKIVVLEDGRKVEEGTHGVLMAIKGLYYKLVELQSKED